MTIALALVMIRIIMTEVTGLDHKGGAANVNLADGKEVLAGAVVVELAGDGRKDKPALLAKTTAELADDISHQGGRRGGI